MLDNGTCAGFATEMFISPTVSSPDVLLINLHTEKGQEPAPKAKHGVAGGGGDRPAHPMLGMAGDAVH